MQPWWTSTPASRLTPFRLGRWGWSGLLVGGAMLIAAAGSPGHRPDPPVKPDPGNHPLPLLAPPGVPAPPSPAAVSPAPVAPALRWAYMTGSKIPPSLAAHAGQIDVLSPAWFQADANGSIHGSDSAAVHAFARARGIRVVPIVANGSFSGGVAHALLTDGNRQTRFLDSLQALLTNDDYAGVNIDFENIPAGDRAGFSALMSNVYARLHPLGKLVTAALPAKLHETTTGFSGPFDYAALAPHLDLAVIMAYDQHYAGGLAGPVADLAWVRDVLSYATSQIPAKKILLGIPFYGYNWNLRGGRALAMTYPKIVASVFAHGAQVRLDPASQSPTFTYTDASGPHKVWFEDSTSLREKLGLGQADGLAGWAAWRLGQEDPNFWSQSLGPAR